MYQITLHFQQAKIQKIRVKKLASIYENMHNYFEHVVLIVFRAEVQLELMNYMVHNNYDAAWLTSTIELAPGNARLENGLAFFASFFFFYYCEPGLMQQG